MTKDRIVNGLDGKPIYMIDKDGEKWGCSGLAGDGSIWWSLAQGNLKRLIELHENYRLALARHEDLGEVLVPGAIQSLVPDRVYPSSMSAAVACAQALNYEEGKPRVHSLKCWPGSFTAIMLGEKTCEYRMNDRDYQAGDVLHLREFAPRIPGLGMKNIGYTGRDLFVRVTYINGLTPEERAAFGIPEGYVVMSIKKFEEIKR